jgi:hypothetical protein
MRTLAAILACFAIAASMPPRSPVISFESANPSNGASFTDTFVRADANPMSNPASGGTWNDGPGAGIACKIVSNALLPTAANSMCSVATPGYGVNQSSEITLGSTPSLMGPVVRVQSSSDASCYLAYISASTTVRIYKMTDTGTLSSSQLGANITVSTIVAGDVLKLSVAGTTLEAFINGVSIGTRTDATWSSGQPGVYFGTTGPKVTNFVGTSP